MEKHILQGKMWNLILLPVLFLLKYIPLELNHLQSVQQDCDGCLLYDPGCSSWTVFVSFNITDQALESTSVRMADLNVFIATMSWLFVKYLAETLSSPWVVSVCAYFSNVFRI